MAQMRSVQQQSEQVVLSYLFAVAVECRTDDLLLGGGLGVTAAGLAALMPA